MNDNCLRGMRCPNCGSEGPFRIEVTTVVVMHDDGCSDCSGDMDWGDNSYCECVRCEHVGFAKMFGEEG